MSTRRIGDVFTSNKKGMPSFSCTKLADGIVHLFLGKSPLFPAKAYCGKEVVSEAECQIPGTDDYFCDKCEGYINFLEGKN